MWDGNGNELKFEESGFFTIDTEESKYLNDGDDDAHRAEEERPERWNRHGGNYEIANGRIEYFCEREERRSDSLVGAAKESTPATRETTRN